MKKLKMLSVLTVVFAVSLLSCRKQEIETTPLASLQVVNAVTGVEALKFGTNAATIATNSATAFGVLTGNHQVKLETSGIVYYDKTHDFLNGGVYSLFLAGTPAVVEQVFVKEEDIVSHTGNVFGVRVINLAPGSTGVTVNVEGAVAGSLFSAVGYTSLTGFKEVSAESSQVIEFREAGSGALIQSFTVPDYDIARFRNITLVFAGTIGGERVFRVNNY